MNKKYWIALGVIVMIIMGVKLLNTSSPANNGESSSEVAAPIVSVSTFTLYEAVHSVAGESVDIRPVIPLGTDAHMFSPNPGTVAEISKSTLFFYNGAGFEKWVEPLTKTLSSQTRIIDMSRHVTLITSEDEEEAQGHEGHEHHHGAYDPHYWLDIDNMIMMTQTIDAELSQAFPANSTLYHANAQRYVAQLKELKTDYAEGLKECKNRVLVSNHDAFGYLAHANGLEHLSVIGLSSDEQPSARNIADIIALVQKHRIKTVFFEEFINDNIAQTIAKETGTTARSLQPLENISEDELESHQTYLSIMRNNLAELRDAMECR